MPTLGEPLGRLSEAIQELGRHDAAEVLAEARATARARVRSMLIDALTQAMLDHAQEELMPTKRPAPSQPQPTPESTPSAPADGRDEAGVDHDTGAESALYVYGVVALQHAAAAAELTDLDNRRSLATVSEGRLSAVVSRVPAEEFAEGRLRAHLNDMDWVETVARGHEQVLDALCRRTTVIPMRLCTVYKTERGVREMLLRESDTLLGALEQLEGKTEWGVKVFFERPRASRTASRDSASTEGGSGAAYMDHRRQERDRARQLDEHVEAAVAEIHETLGSQADESTLNPPQRPEVSDHSGEMVLNGAYLVERESESQFHEKAQMLRSRVAGIGLELVVTGPWPAYNFLPGRIGAAW
jgi:hypothetical protein